MKGRIFVVNLLRPFNLKPGNLTSVFRHSFFKYQFRNMSKSALLILSEGAEEMEAVISADVIRRAGVS